MQVRIYFYVLRVCLRRMYFKRRRTCLDTRSPAHFTARAATRVCFYRGNSCPRELLLYVRDLAQPIPHSRGVCRHTSEFKVAVGYPWHKSKQLVPSFLPPSARVGVYLKLILIPNLNQHHFKFVTSRKVCSREVCYPKEVC